MRNAPGFQRGLILHRLKRFEASLFNDLQLIQHATSMIKKQGMESGEQFFQSGKSRLSVLLFPSL